MIGVGVHKRRYQKPTSCGLCQGYGFPTQRCFQCGAIYAERPPFGGGGVYNDYDPVANPRPDGYFRSGSFPLPKP